MRAYMEPGYALCIGLMIPLEYLSRGSLCSAQLASFWRCKLATSLTWLNCGSRLFVGLVEGGPGTVWLGFSCPSCGALVAGIVKGVLLSSIPIAGGVMGGAFLCMSSMRFTLEVLDLVLMVGVGDGETGGEGIVLQQFLVWTGREC